jgi:pimeloyl-ACP methyl ester carboxylesterase
MIRLLLVLVSLAYFSYCVDLYLTQDDQIYARAANGVILPTDKAIAEARAAGLLPWDHPTPGASSPQGYVPVAFNQPAPRGTIVLFHGNGNWAARRTLYVDAFSRRGFRTFLYEYSGYGGRPGEPHEGSIVPDARALVRELSRDGYGPIYLWGESLGSGVAAAVAADATLPIRGLVLLTPFNRIAGVALYRYPYLPVTLLVRDRYNSVANLAHFTLPIAVVRCDEDEIVPPPLTLLLYASLPEPKKMIVLNGVGHNDWPSAPGLAWWDDALDFIAPKAK